MASLPITKHVEVKKMNKKLLATAVLAALTVSTVSAFAAPVISGDARILAQKNDGEHTYIDTRFRLNADAELGDDIYAHGRIMGIDKQGPQYGLNYAEAGTGLSGASINIEQMYIGAKIGMVDIKAGLQPVEVGHGLLADINGIEGLSLATTAGNVGAYGFAGRSGTDDVVAAQLNTTVENINVGANFLKKESTDYWSINANTKVATNIKLAGEYVKNDTDNKDGYLVKATVGEVAKKGDFNYAVSYRNIDTGAVDAGWTKNGAFADSKGFRLEANYKVGTNANLNLYKDFVDQVSDPSIHPDQMRAELTVNF